jgi:hypothetical protein
MSLVAPTHKTIVGQPSTGVPGRVRVAPGDPEASYLFEKISRDRPTKGKRMPPNQPLDPERIALVRAWIALGAMDD